MSSLHITKEQARRSMLSYHGLCGSHRPKGKDAILAYIRQVGCIQFDPLNIVGLYRGFRYYRRISVWTVYRHI